MTNPASIFPSISKTKYFFIHKAQSSVLYSCRSELVISSCAYDKGVGAYKISTHKRKIAGDTKRSTFSPFLAKSEYSFGEEYRGDLFVGKYVFIKGVEHLIQQLRWNNYSKPTHCMVDNSWVGIGIIDPPTHKVYTYTVMDHEGNITKKRMNVPASIWQTKRIRDYIAHGLSVDVEFVEI